VHRAWLRLLAALLTGAGLAACASAPPVQGPPPAAGADPLAELQSGYAAFAAAGETVYTLDPAQSQVRIYAFRGGRAARLGHDHVLTAPQFAGYFHAPAGGRAGSGFDVLVRLEALALDDPALRAQLGGAFAPALSPEDIAGTREHLLGADGLQAARFPYVSLHSLRIVGDAPKFAAQVRVQIHGQAREIWLALDVEGLPARLAASGAFVLRQSEFGVVPYDVLGGLLSVEDPVVVEFRLVGVPAAARSP
jgi:polyisoprenoid-binding protein YceI